RFEIEIHMHELLADDAAEGVVGLAGTDFLVLAGWPLCAPFHSKGGPVPALPEKLPSHGRLEIADSTDRAPSVLVANRDVARLERESERIRGFEFQEEGETVFRLVAVAFVFDTRSDHQGKLAQSLRFHDRRKGRLGDGDQAEKDEEGRGPQ